MKQIMHERSLITSLTVMYLCDLYSKPLKDKVDLYCYSIFIGKAVRKKTYHKMSDIQTLIYEKRLRLTLNI